MATTNVVDAANAQGADTGLKVEVVRVIRASKQRVFDAWTRPEMVRQWFIAGTVKLADASMDLRKDGAWRMESTGSCQPGEASNAVSGRYLRVEPHDLLSFTWNNAHFPEEESVVTIRLRDVEGGTEMRLLHERFMSEASRADHARGWESVIGNLAEFFAA